MPFSVFIGRHFGNWGNIALLKRFNPCKKLLTFLP